MAADPGHRRWVPAEWQSVAAYTVAFAAQGVPLLKALQKAQRAALPKGRHRDDESLARLLRTPSAQRYLDEARKLAPGKLAALTPLAHPAPPPKPEPKPKLDEGRDYTGQGRIHWTTLEKARLARQINQWRAAGDTRALSRLIIEAQELVIERERRRPVSSIWAAIRKGLNDQLLAEGTANEWLLDAAAPPAEPAAPAPHKAPLPSPIAAPQRAAEPRPTPTPHPAPRRAISDAARAFGETVMGALDTLLAAHTDTVLHDVHARLSVAVADASAVVAAQIAAQIERSLHDTVHRIVEAELGGPVAHPSPPAEAEPAAEEQDDAPPPPDPEPTPEPLAAPAPDPEPEQPRPRQIKVDVVGLHNGSLEQQVLHAVNGSADLRFVNPDAGSAYAPHRGRHCIMITQRVPHALKHKLKAAGVEPIYVKSTAGHVIRAIEELRRAAGIDDGSHG